MKGILYINIIIAAFFPLLSAAQMIYAEADTTPVYTSYCSVDFNGTTQYAAIPNSTSVNFDTSQTFSVEMWVKPMRASPLEVIIKKGAGASGYSILFEDTNTPYPFVSFIIGGSSNFRRIRANVANNAMSNKLNIDFFYHIVCTYDGENSTGAMKIYANGLELTTVADSLGIPVIANSDSLYIAKDPSGDLSKIGFSRMRIYNTALSPVQVVALFGSGIPSPNDQVLADSLEITCLDLSSFINVSPANVKNEKRFPGNYNIFGLVNSENGVYTHPGRGAFGDKGASQLQYVSPVNDLLYSPNVQYDSIEHKTYITGITTGHIGFGNSAVVGELDHTHKTFRWVQLLAPPSEKLADTHMTPSAILSSGGLISVQERTHISDAVVYKGRIGDISPITSFGKKTAYNNLFFVRDSLYSFFRALGSLSDDAQAICKSTDSGSSWSGQSEFLDVKKASWAAYPHVCQSPVSDTTFLFVLGRTTVEFYSGFYHIAAYKTADMVNFYTMSDSLIAIRGTTDSLDANDILTRAVIDKVTDSTQHQMFLYCSRVDTVGRLVVAYRDEESATDSIRIAIWQNGQWVKKNTEIGTNQQRQTPTGALVYKGGADWDFFVIETKNNYDVIVKYSTSDDFTTIDSGTIVSERNKNYTQISSTKYHQLGQPMVITSNMVISDDDESTTLWLYEYIP